MIWIYVLIPASASDVVTRGTQPSCKQSRRIADQRFREPTIEFPASRKAKACVQDARREPESVRVGAQGPRASR